MLLFRKSSLWGAANQDTPLNERCLYSYSCKFWIKKSPSLTCPILHILLFSFESLEDVIRYFSSIIRSSSVNHQAVFCQLGVIKISTWFQKEFGPHCSIPLFYVHFYELFVFGVIYHHLKCWQILTIGSWSEDFISDASQTEENILMVSRILLSSVASHVVTFQNHTIH